MNGHKFLKVTGILMIIGVVHFKCSRKFPKNLLN